MLLVATQVISSAYMFKSKYLITLGRLDQRIWVAQNVSFFCPTQLLLPNKLILVSGGWVDVGLQKTLYPSSPCIHICLASQIIFCTSSLYMTLCFLLSLELFKFLGSKLQRWGLGCSRGGSCAARRVALTKYSLYMQFLAHF